MSRRGTRATGWRRVAASVWGHPNDPQIYGDLEVDATRLLAFIEDARRTSGAHITVIHVVGKAISRRLGENRDLNTQLYRGRFIPRDSVDIFFVASVAGVRKFRASRWWAPTGNPSRRSARSSRAASSGFGPAIASWAERAGFSMRRPSGCSARCSGS